MGTAKRDTYYAEYLQLDKLLKAQAPESTKHGNPVHDEMLFIIVHQAYELWFKQILWELDAVHRIFNQPDVDEREIGKAVSHLERVVRIRSVLLAQIDIVETMTPMDFLDFRDYLTPSSGFQSVQFRLIENKLGLRKDKRLKINKEPYTSKLRADHAALVAASENEKSLMELLDEWLARMPFLEIGEFKFWDSYRAAVHKMLVSDREALEENTGISDEERAVHVKQIESTEQHFDNLFEEDQHNTLVQSGRRALSHNAMLAALFINVYRDEPILRLPFRLLTLLIEVDEAFTAWRYRHVQMVHRMIGSKVGTGGTAGAAYLKKTADRHKVFTDLSELSSYLIPHSARPKLPAEIEEVLSFRFRKP